ncbi:apicoplast triosephosphate translocator APT1 [Babesia ovis]|uniref:Apicoplast triosephosphate translocator APT1 n=1 Tax=Babesia ovis TaxID=5869 RepID=A0A9W5TDF2_BABOV|nr:apicoplast triosephosphate translocator APT1 [Babesia ovis]
MILGAIICLIIWGLGLRPVPKFKDRKKAAKIMLPLALCHLLVNTGAVVSMGLGAISFTQVVKAGEPVFTAILTIVVMHEFLNVYAYLSVIPIVVGIALASVKEVNFNIWAFLFALLSNVASSSRAIIAKVTMKNKEELGENLTAPNIYMLLTVIAGAMSVPIFFGAESYKWKSLWNLKMAKLPSREILLLFLQAFISGVAYYTYNDFSFYCLGQMNPVGHSIANTMKRIFVIVTSIIIFANSVTPLGYVGMAMAVIGALLYSLSVQGVFDRKKKLAEQADVEDSAESIEKSVSMRGV